VAHKIRYAAAIASAFQDLIGQNGDTFRVIELQAALLAASRQICGDNDH
jgi:hypothetical protein